MKKLFKLFLACTMVLTMATGCSKPANDDNGGFDISSIDTSTLGGYLHAEFRTFLSENKDATALATAEHLVATEKILFPGMAVEVEPGLLSGFDNFEVTGFEKGAMFGPMMGTIPFVGYVFQLAEGTDVEAFKSSLKENANLRWNICTEAEELHVENDGNTVFFVMCPKTLEE